MYSTSFPTQKPTPGVGAALPRLDGGGLAHPLRPAGHLLSRHAGLSARHGGFLHPAAAGRAFLPWDLMQVSEAAGVASAAGIHVQKSMVVSGVVVLALTVGSFFLYRGRQKLRWVQRLAGFAASTAATCALIFGVFLQPAVTESLASCRTHGCRTATTATTASSPASSPT